MRFEVVEEVIELDGAQHTGYGIGYTDENSVEHKISDISTNLNAVKNLIDDLNSLSPEEIQLNDIIEDFLFSKI